MTPTERATSATAPSTISLGSASFISALIVVVLAALAFWPKSAWVPPRRPALRAPIVLDEFVNGTPAPASSTSPEPAAH